MSEKDETIFMQPFGEDSPREVRIIDLISEDVPLVTDEIRKNRMETCLSCDKLFENVKCTMCNCFMPIKTWTLDAECPIGKW